MSCPGPDQARLQRTTEIPIDHAQSRACVAHRATCPLNIILYYTILYYTIFRLYYTILYLLSQKASSRGCQAGRGLIRMAWRCVACQTFAASEAPRDLESKLQTKTRAWHNNCKMPGCPHRLLCASTAEVGGPWDESLPEDSETSGATSGSSKSSFMPPARKETQAD